MSPSPVFPDQDPDYAFAMDATPTATARINKFDGTNFHTWKFKMQMVLEERELWEVTKVSQSAGDQLSRDEGFAAAAGSLGEGRA
ncbi:hypothetical protein PC114_g28889 [Phytophthora cactorum]|nr:hypothetical protein PC114_g28889 [Phytophthora cactorum]